MGNAPAAEKWHLKHPARSKLDALYKKTGSIVGVAKALRVARSTAHIWLRVAGVAMRPPGTDPIRKKANAKKYAAAHKIRKDRIRSGQPVEGAERRHCHQGRHWDGVVVLCVHDAGPECVTCTRGYAHSLRVVITSSNGVETGTHEGRRKGVPKSNS